jgi:hypothetical protein
VSAITRRCFAPRFRVGRTQDKTAPFFSPQTQPHHRRPKGRVSDHAAALRTLIPRGSHPRQDSPLLLTPNTNPTIADTRGGDATPVRITLSPPSHRASVQAATSQNRRRCVGFSGGRVGDHAAVLRTLIPREAHPRQDSPPSSHPKHNPTIADTRGGDATIIQVTLSPPSPRASVQAATAAKSPPRRGVSAITRRCYAP